MPHHDVVIVGAGHAGAACAIALRQRGYTGSVALVGDEPDPPYERPPLSKDYLAGDKPFERLLIRPPSFWQERKVTLGLGSRVTAVDPAARHIAIEDAADLEYDHLVWATGGRARRLTCDGHDLRGVHTVRSRSDVDRLIGELPAIRTVVVIGGGFIGLEAAAVLTKLGKRVVVIEALDRVLARVAGEPLSRFFEREHRDHGVEVRLATAVDCILGQGGVVRSVRVAGGEEISADAVIVGIGIVPEVSPLLAAGALGGNGVDVDEWCRTSLPSIFAIGDCASHVSRWGPGSAMRIESVQNAGDQAALVADVISGREPPPYAALPWFWSNQYDHKLQTIGLSTGYDRLVVRGDVASRSFSVVYGRQGRIVALDCVNATKDYVQGRKLVERGVALDETRLADAATPLKDLLH